MFSFMFTLNSLFCFVLQGKKTASGMTVVASRFSNPTTRNVMSGILLTPGPVCTHTGVQSLSRIFRNSINKAKFLLAANRLQSANLGSVVILEKISKSCHVFVKRSPVDIRQYLDTDENGDLCSVEEYAQKFELPPPAPITLKIQHELVEIGLVAAEDFKQQEKRAYAAAFSECTTTAFDLG